MGFRLAVCHDRATSTTPTYPPARYVGQLQLLNVVKHSLHVIHISVTLYAHLDSIRACKHSKALISVDVFDSHSSAQATMSALMQPGFKSVQQAGRPCRAGRSRTRQATVQATMLRSHPELEQSYAKSAPINAFAVSCGPMETPSRNTCRRASTPP